MLKLTILQFLWLNSRGGRTLDDVIIHEGNLCVKMRSNREDTHIEIPSDFRIMHEYNVVQSIKPRYNQIHSNFEFVLRCKF